MSDLRISGLGWQAHPDSNRATISQQVKLNKAAEAQEDKQIPWMRYTLIGMALFVALFLLVMWGVIPVAPAVFASMDIGLKIMFTPGACFWIIVAVIFAHSEPYTPDSPPAPVPRKMAPIGFVQKQKEELIRHISDLEDVISCCHSTLKSKFSNHNQEQSTDDIKRLTHLLCNAVRDIEDYLDTVKGMLTQKDQAIALQINKVFEITNYCVGDALRGRVCALRKVFRFISDKLLKQEKGAGSKALGDTLVEYKDQVEHIHSYLSTLKKAHNDELSRSQRLCVWNNEIQDAFKEVAKNVFQNEVRHELYYEGDGRALL